MSKNELYKTIKREIKQKHIEETLLALGFMCLLGQGAFIELTNRSLKGGIILGGGFLLLLYFALKSGVFQNLFKKDFPILNYIDSCSEETLLKQYQDENGINQIKCSGGYYYLPNHAEYKAITTTKMLESETEAIRLGHLPIQLKEISSP